MNEQTAKARRPLWRRVLRRVVWTIVVLVVVGIAAYAVTDYFVARKIRNEVDAIRARGEPVTFAELAAITAHPDKDRDAGPYYEAAMALEREEDEPEAFHDALADGNKPSETNIAAAQHYVERCRLALELLDRGAPLPDCNFDMGLEYGMSAGLSKLNRPRGLVNNASVRTRLLAVQGKGDEAIASAASCLRMTRVMDGQPVMVDYLVKVGCIAVVCRDVRIILDWGHPSVQSLEAIEKALAETEQGIGVRRMFIGERVYGLELMRNVIGETRPPGDNSAPVPEAQMWPSGLPSRIWAAEMLPLYKEFLDAADKGYPGILDAMAVIANRPPSKLNPFASILTPSVQRGAITIAKCLADLRTSGAAIRIERYRIERARLPDALMDISGQSARSLLDPFTGRNLIYRKTGDGYCVYSVSEDQRDDGGKDLRGADWGIKIRTTNSPATTPAAR